MKKYEFNRNEFKWGEEYYDVIQKKMNLPKFFGKNADALWDMLTGFVETPCEITLIGFNKNENEYNKMIIDKINLCFQDAAKKYPEKFKLIFLED
ncbi:MAG: barstar family protein [Clostridia bacterium]|nr:barstar family protein [Clostridia bacterium]